jgi:hypothetical protein
LFLASPSSVSTPFVSATGNRKLSRKGFGETNGHVLERDFWPGIPYG